MSDVDPQDNIGGPRPEAQPSAGLGSLWLSDLSIRQPVFITMLILTVMIVGGLAYARMPLDLFPDITLPVTVVKTVYPGASPEEVERTVTQPIEDAVASLNGVEDIRSTTAESLSLVIVEFNMNKDGRAATEDVRTQLSQLRQALPPEVEAPVILPFDPSASPIVSYAVADPGGRRSAEDLRRLVDETLKPRLEQVAGVAAMESVGGQAPQVHVTLERERLESTGIPPQQVIQAIRSQHLAMPAGRLVDGEREESLQVAGELQSLGQLEELPVATGPDGQTTRVRDLGSVTLGYSEERALSRLDGQASLVLNIRKQSGANTVRVADDVQAEVDRLQQEYPGLRFAIAADQATFTRESVQDVQLSLALGALLAALVVLLFFRDIRNTLVTIAGLPVVVLGTFGVLHLLGITLNMISMMALSLSIGMLIDDAIVVRENIFRHLERGAEPRVAASRGTAEIALAVLAITSTIVAVFLPIAFTEGIAGKFLRDFGVTVAVAVLISLAEALTLAPMLSAHFFKPAARATSRPGRFVRLSGAPGRGYRSLLEWSLRHRLVVVALGTLAMVGSLALIPHLKLAFQPETDQGRFTVGIRLPPGARLAETDAAARNVEHVLGADPAVAHVLARVGSADGAVDKATLTATLQGRGQTAAVIARLRPEIEQAVNGASIAINREESTAMADSAVADAIRGRPIQFAVQGDDDRLIEQVSEELAQRLAAVTGAVDVERSVTAGRPSQLIVFDRARANDLGVPVAQVSTTVRALISGERVGVYRAGDEEADIVVRLSEADRQAAGDILRLPIVTTRGTQVPLGAVANIVESTEPSEIAREDRQRQILVGAGTLGRDQAAVLAEAHQAVEAMALPPGVTIRAAGEARYQDETFASLGRALGLSVLFVYMILASQFGSFIHPFTIMLALPFSIVGSLLALFLGGFNFDTLAMIGLILLMGLVAKNSILLVEFINQLRRRGLSTGAAILEAGPVRLRPILMTTLAMIFGMAPMAAGLGAGAELRRAMGVSVIGGLITSTLLTLVVVPVVYSLIDDLGQLRFPWLRGVERPAPTAAPHERRVLPGLSRRLGGAVAALVVLAVAGHTALRSSMPQSSPQPAVPSVPTSRPLPTVAPTPVVAADPSATPRSIAAASGIGTRPGLPAPSTVAGSQAAQAPQSPAQPASGSMLVGNTSQMGANLRQAPGTSAPRIAALPEGATVEQLGESTESGGRHWVKVRDASGAIGWVVEDFLVRAAG